MIKLARPCLLLSAVLLLTPWLTSYAYGAGDGRAGDEAVHVAAAEPMKAPSVTLFGKAISSITPGDLFYIDATASPHDITVNLYLTNTDELIHYLRYLILKIGIYFENSDGLWQPASLPDGNPLPDTFITLRNSPVSFTLDGDTKYKISIDAGSGYCLAANNNGDNPSPQFYLTVEPS